MTTAGAPGAVYDLAHFTLSDMTRCGRELRKLGATASSMEEVANRIVRFLHSSFRTSATDEPACALVRLFTTLPFASLEPAQQDFVHGLGAAGQPGPETKCLTLLATAGHQPSWNSRHSSAQHKALPLVSEASVARSPMIAQLIAQLGMEIGALTGTGEDFLVDVDQHTFNVFHVRDAEGSPYIPAQQTFVIPHGIRSVLGFGGLLPSRELFAIILFSTCTIDRERADLFKTLALNAKVAILPFAGGQIFA